MNDILCHIQHGIATIILNRPKALNALNLSMVESMLEILQKWQQDPQIQAVIVHSADTRAFCAGGDIRSVYEAYQRQDQNYTQSLFRAEYTLNHLIAYYSKPYICLINGLCMGGGMGISMHGAVRILGEKAVLAMPETQIGFFPDVGSSYFLNRSPGAMGRYFGLTGAHANASDSLYLGWGTHYMPEAQQKKFVQDLMVDPSSLPHLLNKHSYPINQSSLIKAQDFIDQVFQLPSIENMLEALKACAQPWTQEIYATLLKKSPTSLKLTLVQLDNTQGLSLTDILKIDYRISQHCLRRHDFYEGVRALLIDKDQNPLWQPVTLEEVKLADIEAYLKPLKNISELDLVRK